ncbi:sulfatase family protein [Pontiella sulfatireligans]|uniref:Arylsulfatase n=1 Tax=Pontiella sulfatireligans TaxID=2750658 RepID=A0A6C2UE98_9BACT|nr:arylsulfatase [Pontiella sulfatireligans]SPS74182.1 sulfatase S1_15 [Kiritimatiellales bacterium]VGO18542.1 Arylsulfatase [Pontiella sulfatireligans]
MMNRNVLFTLLFSCCLSFGYADKKPNIVYILADDMGPGDVSCYNPEGKIQTPYIDRLAAEGMKFTDAHTSSSVCTPTRYGILTGRYCWRTNKKDGVLSGYCPPLIEVGRETIASFLKKEGYQTASIGKWHLGLDWVHTSPKKMKRISPDYVDHTQPISNGPLELGFDYFYRVQGSTFYFLENRHVIGDLTYKTAEEMEALGYDPKAKFIVEGIQQKDRISIVAEKTCDWIKEHATEPFFVYMALPSPHDPITPSEQFQGKSGLCPHGDFVMETDWAVGEVLKTLDALNLADNTLVLFTSDNGTSGSAGIGQMQKLGHYSSGIYRGAKSSIFEGGHRMPFIVRWPGEVETSSVSDQLISTTDMLATLTELFNKTLPDNEGEDSVSFLPALKGQPIPGATERLIIHNDNRGYFAARKGKWKLVINNKGFDAGKQKKSSNPIANIADMMLFDMDNDPSETVNLLAQYPEVVESMKKELGSIITAGRSTPGEDQPTDVEELGEKWFQLDSIRDYLNK